MYDRIQREPSEIRRQKRALQRYLILYACLMSLLLLSSPSAIGQQGSSEPLDPWVDAIEALDPEGLYAGADVIRAFESLRSVALQMLEASSLAAAQEVRAQIEPDLRAALVYKDEYERMRKKLLWIPASAIVGLISGFVFGTL